MERVQKPDKSLESAMSGFQHISVSQFVDFVTWELEGPPVAGLLQELSSMQILSCLKMWVPIQLFPESEHTNSSLKLVIEELSFNFLLSTEDKICQI